MFDLVRELESLSSAEVEELFHRDEELVRHANAIREKQAVKPTQSQFRVIAILLVTHSVPEEDDKLRWALICGSNIEHGYLGGALCAERAALCRTRFLHNPLVRKAVVTTDSKHGISPGALCREFLMSMSESDMPVVISNNSGDKVTKCTISDLVPFPYFFRKAHRGELALCAETLASKVRSRERALLSSTATTASASASSTTSSESTESNERENMISLVLAAARDANALDNAGDSGHPIRLSAAVIYENLATDSAFQLKGLEYGCTVDPVAQLVYAMEHRQEKPVFLVMLDNYGLAHAPFAGARAQLTERRRYDDLQVLVHREEDGELVGVFVKELLPQPPGSDAKLLTHDDFK